jgi:hypothetical protein
MGEGFYEGLGEVVMEQPEGQKDEEGEEDAMGEPEDEMSSGIDT